MEKCRSICTVPNIDRLFLVYFIMITLIFLLYMIYRLLVGMLVITCDLSSAVMLLLNGVILTILIHIYDVLNFYIALNFYNFTKYFAL